MNDEKIVHEYKIEVTRDGRWWMIHIPDVGGLTQARRLSEVDYMARDYIALVTHTPIDEIAVRVASIEVPGLGDIAAAAHHIVSEREAAAHAVAAAQGNLTRYAKAFVDAGIPIRDAAELLDVSFQRVGQLVSEKDGSASGA
jgi:hypothetical protein